MDRVPLLKTKEGLSAQQADLFDWVVESRGKMIRPYEVLLHSPGLARPAAELGHMIRYEGSLSDHDRELAIITAAKVLKCDFEWQSHIELARAAGVAESAIEFLLGDASRELNEREELIVGFVRELTEDKDVSDQRFTQTAEAFGHSGVVELTALVGYYTMLGYVMNVAGAG